MMHYSCSSSGGGFRKPGRRLPAQMRCPGLPEYTVANDGGDIGLQAISPPLYTSEFYLNGGWFFVRFLTPVPYLTIIGIDHLGDHLGAIFIQFRLRQGHPIEVDNDLFVYLGENDKAQFGGREQFLFFNFQVHERIAAMCCSILNFNRQNPETSVGVAYGRG